MATSGDPDGVGSSTITYDLLGNISRYQSKGRDLSYSYDSNNRLTAVSGIADKYQSIQYDSRGNTIHNGKDSFSFNHAGQLKHAKDGSNSYLYYGHNRRVKQNDGEGVSYSLYSQDGTLFYRETELGAVNYIYLGKKLIAKDGVIPTNSGKQHYRPYGESIEGPNEDVGYTGHKYDTDIALSYMQARYYDPVIGRFYSNDPVDAIGHIDLGSVQGFNRYNYTYNNPYRYVDPDGLAPGDPFDTPEKAAEDFGMVFNEESIEKDIELGSSIYSYTDDAGDTKYSYSEPTRGGQTGVDPNPVVKDGQKIISTVHSHAAYKRRSDNEPSGGDFRTLLGDNDEYLTTPNGSLIWYNNGKKDGYDTPGFGRVLGVKLPSDKNDPTSR